MAGGTQYRLFTTIHKMLRCISQKYRLETDPLRIPYGSAIIGHSDDQSSTLRVQESRQRSSEPYPLGDHPCQTSRIPRVKIDSQRRLELHQVQTLPLVIGVPFRNP